MLRPTTVRYPYGGSRTFVTGPGGLMPGRQGYNESAAAVSAADSAALADMAGAKSDAYGSYASGLAGMYSPFAQAAASAGNNYAQMFDAYSRGAGKYFGAVANLGANAMAQQQNANQGRYSAYAQGVNSYNNLLGSLGTAALSGYGTAANAAMQAQALNSTAALKAMADLAGQNQQAQSLLGSSRNQALAGLAGSYGSAGTGLANARAVNSRAASDLAAQVAAAQSNLGSARATASGVLGSSALQSESALRAAIANALAATSQAESAGLATTNAGQSTALAGLAPAIASSAAADLNYTRDMAKLGLARELGLTSANVAGSFDVSGSFPGSGSSGSGNLTISGPNGVIAGGSAGDWASGGGGGGFSRTSSYTPVDPRANEPWYASRQSGGGAGLSALGTLRDSINSGATDGRRSISLPAADTRAMLAGQATDGSAAIQALANRGISGDTGSSISDALRQGMNQISTSGAGIDADAANTFQGLNATQRYIMSNDVLNSLNSTYSDASGQLQRVFERGQTDPASIYADARSDIQSILSPLVDRGTTALDQFYGNFPSPLANSPSGQLDPGPYLQALSDAYDPYMQNLNAAFLNQNNLVTGSLGSAANELATGRNALGDGFGRTLSSIDLDGEGLRQPTEEPEEMTPEEAAQLKYRELFARAQAGDRFALKRLTDASRTQNKLQDFLRRGLVNPTT